MKKHKFLSFLGIAAVLFTACSNDDDPVAVNQEEVITTVEVTLTHESETVKLRFYDGDGDGPDNGIYTISGNLKSNTTYNGTIVLLNETENPAEIVNDEIEEEADEHQFFYLTQDLGITTAYMDTECNYSDDPDCTSTLPVGISFTLSTTDLTGSAKFSIILRHELDKGAANVSNGDITNAGGSTDIETNFDIIIE